MDDVFANGSGTAQIQWQENLGQSALKLIQRYHTGSCLHHGEQASFVSSRSVIFPMW